MRTIALRVFVPLIGFGSLLVGAPLSAADAPPDQKRCVQQESAMAKGTAALEPAQPTATLKRVCGGGHFIGVSYDPEWWPEAQWADDFHRMRDIGFTVVRMGDFSWAAFEPREGEYHFEWLENAVALARREGISVMLATPTAGIPPWLYKKNHDVLGANENGALTYGGRKGASLHSETMRSAAEKLVNEMARRFAGNPAVVGWQISNEPGYPFTNYDKNALEAFRVWLKNRYGSIDKLNQAWWGVFWSNNYNDWNEIQFPTNSAEGGWRSGSRLDYRRFFCDSFLDWIGFEKDILKRQVKDQFIFTNWPDTRWSVDLYRTESLFNITAWDNYSAIPGTTDWHAQFYASSNHDLARCSRADKLFFVAEQGSQAHANSKPKAIRLQTYLGLAHGSQGTLFYEWRPPLGGNEQAYKSVLNIDGSYGPAEQQYRRMTKEFAQIGKEIAGATTESDIAMIYSYDNQWEQGFWRGKTAFEIATSLTNDGYDINFQRLYNGAKALGRNVDVIAANTSKSRYRMVVAPSLQMVSDEEAKQLEEYVAQGGILVLDPASGTRDMESRNRPVLPPGAFAGIAGIKITTTLPMIRTTERYGMVLPSGREAEATKTVEGIELNGAKAITSFKGKGMDGRPAVTINRHGNGFVVYIASITTDRAFYDELFKMLGKQFKIAPLLNVPDGVEVVTRTKGGVDYYFVMNFESKEKVVDLPRPMFELISNEAGVRSVKLSAFEVAVLKQYQNIR